MTTAWEFGSALNDRYEVRREIGTGGMATVFLARDVKHERDVAIKVRVGVREFRWKAARSRGGRRMARRSFTERRRD